MTTSYILTPTEQKSAQQVAGEQIGLQGAYDSIENIRQDLLLHWRLHQNILEKNHANTSLVDDAYSSVNEILVGMRKTALNFQPPVP